MFLLIPLLVVITASAQSPPYYDIGEADNLFKEFVQKHGKTYNPEEYLTRLDIFKQNLKRINERNARYPQNEVGITRFTDLTTEERRQYLGFKRFDAASDGRAMRLEYPAEAVTAPDQFDWRDHDAVTHVKDQGHCQSSWVFSATGNIEGQYAIKHKELIALSEQEGIDCATNKNKKDSTCMEGWPDDLMYYYHFHSKFNEGYVTPESEYPYTGIPAICQMWNGINKTYVTTVTSFQVLVPKDEETLKQFLYETGPLAVGLDSSELYEYTKGIYTPEESEECKGEADHAVLLVGYGIENGKKYWTLKNSWGEGWGEKGYFRLVRGKKACYMGLSYTATCTVS
ncbi:procathepsin L-like [Cydia fagiglandana]|uniref:procathepsin L-like n=1 Tax=Cydia fagiglandana TaxID=1458189 RepID=UPI002FEE3C11